MRTAVGPKDLFAATASRTRAGIWEPESTAMSSAGPTAACGRADVNQASAHLRTRNGDGDLLGQVVHLAVALRRDCRGRFPEEALAFRSSPPAVLQGQMGQFRIELLPGNGNNKRMITQG